MIACITGELLEKQPMRVLIEAHGVGYEVKISPHTYAQLQSLTQVRLHTYLHIKEDAHTLYGFLEAVDKVCFLDLMRVKGVGPNMAMTILAALRPTELQAAIAQADAGRIKSVKGVGTKVAQRIILELKDHFSVPLHHAAVPDSHYTVQTEALQALIALGLSKTAAQEAIQRLCQQATTPPTVEALIKAVLRGD